MFQPTHLILTSVAIVALGSVNAANVEVTDLPPFTHVVSIPADTDLSSIRLESVKTVKIATKRRVEFNAQYCSERAMDSGGSAYCPATKDEAPVPAYEFKYSFRGQPMASDESNATRFMFSVYFRAEDFSPAVRKTLDSRTARTDAAGLFQLTTARNTVPRLVIDKANSILCPGDYVDGQWVPANAACVERISYETVLRPSSYASARVELASHSSERVAVAAAASGSAGRQQ
jgi:hypothetical protein